jgi:hypothetical protein
MTQARMIFQTLPRSCEGPTVAHISSPSAVVGKAFEDFFSCFAVQAVYPLADRAARFALHALGSEPDAWCACDAIERPTGAPLVFGTMMAVSSHVHHIEGPTYTRTKLLRRDKVFEGRHLRPPRSGFR